MGKANLYTVKDYLTGEVLAKGTAGELEASGIVPKATTPASGPSTRTRSDGTGNTQSLLRNGSRK